jgi:hypothetical protein
MNAYEQLCRDIVHAQGEPEHFRAREVSLTDARLAIVLADFDHILPEVAADHAPKLLDAMAGEVPSGYASLREYIGAVILSAARARAEFAMRNDLECTANDMEMEKRTDEVHS